MPLWGNRDKRKFNSGVEDEPQIEREYFIYRNGDSRSKPITYVHTCGDKGRYKNFDALLQGLTKDIKPLYEGPIKQLWTANGRRKVVDMDQFETGFETEFVAVGDEGFVHVKGGYERLKHGRDKNSSSESEDDERRENHRVYGAGGTRVGSPRTRGKYRRDSKDRRSNSKGRRRSPTPEDSFRIWIRPNDDSKAKPVRYDYSSKKDKDMGELLEHLDDYVKLRRGRAEFLFNMGGDLVENPRELRDNETYVVSDTDRFRLGTERSKSKGRDGDDDITTESRRRGYHRRDPEHRVFNRKDQTTKEDLVLHVFFNGVSQDPKAVKFSKKQQTQKGIEHVLDECSREFGGTAHKSRLYTIDGARIDEPGELIQKGAYVYVPGGRKFNTKVWYYIPSYAKDTSTNSDEEGPKENEGGGRERSPSPGRSKSRGRGGSKDRR